MSLLRAETKVRARTLQLLYATELRPDDVPVETSIGWPGEIPSKTIVAAEELANQIRRTCSEIDAEIEQSADNWRLSRLGVTERNILRLAVFEMRERRAPVRVIINEAVRLAHWFAGQKAPGFVNGVLDAIARRRGQL